MSTFHVIDPDSLAYLGSVEAVDLAAAADLAAAVWSRPVKVLTWRPSVGCRAAS